MSKGNRNLQLMLVAATIAASLALLAFVAFNPLPNRNSNTDNTSVPCSTYHTTWVVIANERGFNDSIDHGVPQNYWPVLCVHLGDSVTVHVFNTGTEPHGFSIGTYFEQGASLPQGSNITVTFTANRAGSFLIFCTIFCAVHPWMLSGLLVVR